MLGVFGGRFSNNYLATTSVAASTPARSLPGYELVIELDHRFVLSPSVYIQLNIQVVITQVEREGFQHPWWWGHKLDSSYEDAAVHHDNADGRKELPKR